MEYEVHTAKKTLRKYRVHILIGLSVLILIGLTIAISTHDSDEDQSDQGPQQEKHEQNASIPVPVSESPEEPPQAIIQEHTTTVDITDYKIINTYVREGKQYYTQGLLFTDSNTLLESTGVYGESVIHYLSFPNMTVLSENALGSAYFGEGCDIVDNKGALEIYQLTWQNRKIFVWDAATLKQKRILDLPQPIKSGWGLAKRIETDSNGNKVARLYITDGTNNVYIVDPITMKVLKTIPVKLHNGKQVWSLNELEFIKGYLWANIYMSNNIAVINLDTGYADYMIHLNGLDTLAKQKANEMQLSIQNDYVLNGIAYDSTNDRLIIAGKKWPLMWQIQIDGIN